MAITKSAKKAYRVSARRKVYNDRRSKAMRLAILQVKKLVKERKLKEASKVLAIAYKAIDKALKGGVIKKNNAARKKSLLARMINSK